jgi:hypothetical protein
VIPAADKKLLKGEKMRRIVLIAAVLLTTTPVFAFDLLGPTTTKLRAAGQTSVALEYFWSDMEMDADGIPELGLLEGTIDDVEFNKVSVNFALGMGRSSEVFLRLGVAQAEPDRGSNIYDIEHIAGYLGESDEYFFIGGGAKWTLFKWENASWGLLAQASRSSMDFDQRINVIGGNLVNFAADVELIEVQVATGPTVQLYENIAVYGGPFLYWLDGDADLEGSVNGVPGSVDTDLEQESILGGYIGTQIMLTKRLQLNAEFQTTSGSRGAGGQLVWKF